MPSLPGTLTSFLLLSVVFLPLERLFPGNRQRILRAEWGTDLLFFLGQYLLWTAPVVAVLVAVQRHIGVPPVRELQASFASLPFWLQFALVIVLSDFCIYWAHRFAHRNGFLWRFHRVHHTAEHVDWLAAHREHPVDNLYTRLVENLPPIALGFPMPALAGLAMFRGLWAIFIHANVSLSPGPLRYLLGAPRLHHWHHEIEHCGRVNFANLSPLMDLLFGTFHDPGRMPARYGIPDRIAHDYLAQIVAPLWPARLWRRLRGGLGERGAQPTSAAPTSSSKSCRPG